jgi:hypothetical protein
MIPSRYLLLKLRSHHIHDFPLLRDRDAGVRHRVEDQRLLKCGVVIETMLANSWIGFTKGKEQPFSRPVTHSLDKGLLCSVLLLLCSVLIKDALRHLLTNNLIDDGRQLPSCAGAFELKSVFSAIDERATYYKLERGHIPGKKAGNIWVSTLAARPIAPESERISIMVDYNSAGTQQSFDIIPADTIVVVQMHIRPGGAGPDGLFKRSKEGQAEMLDCEFTVVEGEFVKRKFWTNMVVSGTTDGHATAADITNRSLRAILESARGIKPEDMSDKAKAARSAEFDDFDGIRFMCRLGVEPAKDGYRAKNILPSGSIITPDRKEWHAIDQQPKTAKAKKGADNAPVPITKPAWASS